MDSRQLEMFTAAYDTRSITQAATKLYLSRQTVSASLAAFERSLGIALFNRTATGLEPTEAAHVLREFAERQDEMWRECLIRMQQKTQVRQLRVGGSLLFMQPSLLKSILQLQTIDPNIQIGFTNMDDMSRLTAMVIDGTVDVAGIWQIPDNEHLDPLMLFASPMLVLMGEKNPLATLEAIDYTTDLDGATLLFVSKETFAQVAPSMGTKGIRGKVVEPNAGLIQSLLEAENMVFPIPTHHAPGLQSEGIVARRVLNYPMCGVSAIMTARPKTRFLDNVASWFASQENAEKAFTWEDALTMDAENFGGVYTFLPPEEGSRVWDIPCPWSTSESVCCDHCRQAHTPHA